jgi:hypothetical protein
MMDKYYQSRQEKQTDLDDDFEQRFDEEFLSEFHSINGENDPDNG